ncbi:MAG TPA: hypothetical protein VHF26_19905 [Trebonia sp.]|nr:hypothetical protein [Trebonia sp.]
MTGGPAPLILFAVAAPAWLVVAAYGVALGCLGFLNPVWETAVQHEVPAEVLGRVSAYDWLVSLGAMPLGYALGPVLAREFGYTWPLVGAAALVLVTLSIPVSLPEVRNLRLHPAPKSGDPVPGAPVPGLSPDQLPTSS